VYSIHQCYPTLQTGAIAPAVDALVWFQLLGLVVVVVLLQLVLLLFFFFFFFPHSGHHSSEKRTRTLEICQSLETKCGFYYFLPT
jgi:hypothetical protein